jgi:hypothetical protein
MSINAKWVSKKVQVELPLNSSDLLFLEKYLKKAGYIFNKETGDFECIPRDDSAEPITWKMKTTPRSTIISTFKGRSFPFEEDLRRIIYHVVPKCAYIIKGGKDDSDKVIKTLFKNDFELVGISNEGTFQRFMKRGNEAFLLYKVKDAFHLYFNGRDDASRPFLSAFSVS